MLGSNDTYDYYLCLSLRFGYPLFIFSYTCVTPSGKKAEFELFFEQCVGLRLVERAREDAPGERNNRIHPGLLTGC